MLAAMDQQEVERKLDERERLSVKAEAMRRIGQREAEAGFRAKIRRLELELRAEGVDPDDPDA
jgi:hypothetical protein